MNPTLRCHAVGLFLTKLAELVQAESSVDAAALMSVIAEQVDRAVADSREEGIAEGWQKGFDTATAIEEANRRLRAARAEAAVAALRAHDATDRLLETMEQTLLVNATEIVH